MIMNRASDFLVHMDRASYEPGVRLRGSHEPGVRLLVHLWSIPKKN